MSSCISNQCCCRVGQRSRWFLQSCASCVIVWSLRVLFGIVDQTFGCVGNSTSRFEQRLARRLVWSILGHHFGWSNKSTRSTSSSSFFVFVFYFILFLKKEKFLDFFFLKKEINLIFNKKKERQQWITLYFWEFLVVVQQMQRVWRLLRAMNELSLQMQQHFASVSIHLHQQLATNEQLHHWHSWLMQAKHQNQQRWSMIFNFEKKSTFDLFFQ